MSICNDKGLISTYEENKNLSEEFKTEVDNTCMNGILQQSGLRIQVVINNEPSDAVIKKFAKALNELLKGKEELA